MKSDLKVKNLRQPTDGDQAFLSDLSELRKRAREQMMKGAITPSYPEADRKAIAELLNTALATELVCVLRYKRHYYVTHGIRAKFVAAEFLEHAGEEQAHADQIAERIVQLGEDPDLNPATLLSRAHSEYDEATSLRQMLEADLFAERIAIESYREMITFIGPRDPTTRRMLESILAQEEEHAEDLVDLLEDLPKD
ncbi:MAG TPA: ferritin-like domain-containing protein [Steroidobacteraceae bacterium]|jgi:bacterioferritin|nr:ferritin-like domain-containing protein [Steroidobacteraceae bacterium]